MFGKSLRMETNLGESSVVEDISFVWEAVPDEAEFACIDVSTLSGANELHNEFCCLCTGQQSIDEVDYAYPSWCPGE